MKDGTNIKINSELLKEIFKINTKNTPTFISLNNKFFIAEVTEEENNILELSNKNVLDTVKKQLSIVNLVKENASIRKN